MITLEDLHRLVKSLEAQDKRADDLTLRLEDLENLEAGGVDVVPWTDYSS